MGCCVSTPRDPLFALRTATLAEANVDGICVGLIGEWLRNLPNSPRSRMNALEPESKAHRAAAEMQDKYQDIRARLRREGVNHSEANMRAKNTVLREATGLELIGEESVYSFDKPEERLRMRQQITADGSKHLLSLRFADVQPRHAIATSASNGEITLFDPNYGEFTGPSEESWTKELFQRLSNRYRSPNGLIISTITTQEMRKQGEGASLANSQNS
ncbi:YopT-type cysteine protease domain-containing protein [Bradyrhizobium sp. CCBAU 11357]|uniref:YopT-type cysteine protease domain-containing protein n=1 Tax=Bradyrhizobium sp. CCBAU 11357 TaxID=1630808 RepID=UPI0023049BE4|nr:YopT-type cysteine protease domain-containing protein [Bradyrhizobium sp. CCBAU 11357]MDA9497817.1 hypothetical protein [Bradyrhizobium sp. CCBAU 11357]